MAAAAFVTSERAARYRSITARRGTPAYPETDLAPRDRIRAGTCATTPIAGFRLAHPVVAATGLHRRAGEPGHRVCRGALAGALLWAVLVHLGDAGRAGPDFPDGRLLRRGPPGRPPPRGETALSVGRRGGSSYGGPFRCGAGAPFPRPRRDGPGGPRRR